MQQQLGQTDEADPIRRGIDVTDRRAPLLL
jgi:hypothetical protein